MSIGSESLLISYLSYIKWTQDTFPSDTQSVFLLLERCTRAFLHDEASTSTSTTSDDNDKDKYHNDVRYVRTAIMYADKTSAPGDVFKYLHKRGVGSRCSLFWIAW